MAAAAHAADPKASRFYEDALTRYEKKDYAGAVIQLKNALQIDPKMLPVQVLLGQALLANGEVAAAEVAFREAMRLGVSRSEVAVPLAESVVAQGKLRALFDQAEFALPGLSSDTQFSLLMMRASAYSDLGDVRSALRTIDEARALRPQSADTWFAEVPIRIRTRQFKEAHAAADRSIALAPQSAEGLYLKGSIAHAQIDIKTALDWYTRALKQQPSHLETLIARAGIHIDIDRSADADRDVTTALDKAPKDPRVVYLKALLAERKGDAATVKKTLNEVTALIDPVPLDFIRYRPQLLMLNGMAHFGLNEREKAKPYFEAFQAVQGNTPVSKMLAQIYVSESNLDRAISVLETYLKAQPNDPQALVLLASTHMAQGRNARAISLMQEALRTQDSPTFRTVLGLGLMGSGQAGGAQRELETSFKRDPNQTRAGAALVGLYLRSGEPSKAIATAETLTKQAPNNSGYHNLLGMALASTGKVKEARASFERALKLEPKLTDARINLARLDTATKAYAEADARLNDILKEDDKNIDAMMEMAVLAQARKDAEGQLRWLQKAHDVAGPRELRPGLALTGRHMVDRNLPQALAVAKRTSEKQPEDIGALMLLARVYLASNDAINARTTLTNATRFAEYNAPLQIEIARLQLAAGNPDGATYNVEKALSGRPDFVPAIAMMTEIEINRKDWAAAEKLARDVQQRAPTSALGHSLAGDIARARGQWAAAAEAYRRAHQVAPTSSTLLNLFQTLAAQDATGRAAMPVAEQWLKTHPRDEAVLQAYGDAQARAGAFAAARTTYESILKLSPERVETLNNLANALIELKDYPQAVKVAEQAAAKAPNSPLVIDTLGWALFNAGQTDRALQLLRDARLRAPDNAEIRTHLAIALHKLGRKQEATQEAKAALRLAQNFPGAEAARRIAQD